MNYNGNNLYKNTIGGGGGTSRRNLKEPPVRLRGSQVMEVCGDVPVGQEI